MTKQKSALQRLSWKIAEHVAELIDDSYRMEKEFSTEDIYRIVYLALPHDMEADALADEEFARQLTENGIKKDTGPTLMQRLRESVYADKGTPLKVVIEAAIKAANERNVLFLELDSAELVGEAARLNKIKNQLVASIFGGICNFQGQRCGNCKRCLEVDELLKKIEERDLDTPQP